MSMPAPASISEMVGQSLEIVSRPSVSTFERFERRGTATQALAYVGIVAAVSGLFGLGNGLDGLLTNVLGTLAGFFAFTGLVYLVGRQQGGSGSFDEVAYSFSLFYVPIALALTALNFLLAITIIGLLLVPLALLAAVVAQVYFAYLAVQSSMNLTDRAKVILTLVVAAVGTLLAQGLVLRLVNV